MGFNWLYKHSASQQVFVSADNDVARIPHRFILQHVMAKLKKDIVYDISSEK